MQLQEELKRNLDELHALKDDSNIQRQLMEKGLGDAKSTQEQHDALRAHVLTVARAVLRKFGVLFGCFLYSLLGVCDTKFVCDCR